MTGATARRYLVRGRVQGVGFRFFVEEAARSLGVAGFVRNLPDGRVEVLAQADGEQLTRLEEALRRGPPLARVEDLEVRDAAAEPARGGFDLPF